MSQSYHYQKGAQHLVNFSCPSTQPLLMPLVLRVMPDDNSCLFRALAAAVLPGDDLSMPELRSLVASTIQAEPEIYTKVVLEKSPDAYCRWIQSPDSWGGAIEMGILAQYFDIEICSIDVQVRSATPFCKASTYIFSVPSSGQVQRG